MRVRPIARAGEADDGGGGAAPTARAARRDNRTGAAAAQDLKKIIRCSRRLQRSPTKAARALSHSDTFTFLLNFY